MARVPCRAAGGVAAGMRSRRARCARKNRACPGTSSRGRAIVRPDLSLLPHQTISEEHARLILVVRAAAELNVFGGRRTTLRIGGDVMEFEECRLAASAFASDERAASLIASPDDTPNSCWYVTARRGLFVTVRSRGCARGEPSMLDLLDQQRQCAVQD